MHSLTRLHGNRVWMEAQMQPLGNPRRDAAQARNATMNSVDRIALAAAFVVAIFVLVLADFNETSAMPRTHAAATVGNSAAAAASTAAQETCAPALPTAKEED
jgi:hypothetical protein